MGMWVLWLLSVPWGSFGSGLLIPAFAIGVPPDQRLYSDQVLLFLDCDIVSDERRNFIPAKPHIPLKIKRILLYREAIFQADEIIQIGVIPVDDLEPVLNVFVALVVML